MRAVGVDLGGTKVLAAAVHDGEPHHTVKVATPTDSADAVIAAVVEAVGRVVEADGHELQRVGVGAPGPVDATGVVRDAPNLVGFGRPVDLRRHLAEAFGSEAEVRIDNDVNVAALGEARHGAGRDAGDLLAVWWGTGVGGGLVLAGEVRRGVHGLAGEIGHLTIRADGRRCRCGGIGHLEAYAGRAAMEAEARRQHAAGTRTLLVELAGEERMRSKVWAKALRAGDVVATRLVAEAVEALGIGIASALAVIDAEVVVLGGGLADRLGEPLVAQVGDAVAARVFGTTDVRVVGAALGDDAGVVGAAELFV